MATGAAAMRQAERAIERVAANCWAVPSASAPGELHVVSVHLGRLGGRVWVCDCTGFAYRGTCAYIARVVASAPRPVPAAVPAGLRPTVSRQPRKQVAL